MNKKILLLTLVSLFLLSAMVVTSVTAQVRTVGVSEGDWFKYEDISVSWSSNDPNMTIPDHIKEFNDTEWMLFSVTDVSGTNITFQMVAYYKDGSNETEVAYLDIDTGLSDYASFMAISANLNANDPIYSSGYYSAWKINETIVMTYPDEVRNTNHVNITAEDSGWQNETEFYHCTSLILYWDRSSGIIVEASEEQINQKGDYQTSYSYSLRITESNVWIIPEFPSFLVLPLFMMATLLAVTVYKRKHQTRNKKREV